MELIDHSACSPDCKISLRLVENLRGYNITLRAIRNDATLEAKTFHFSECQSVSVSLRTSVLMDMSLTDGPLTMLLSVTFPSCTAPLSLSSIHVYSTTTTAVLSWKLHRQQSLSTLSLFNTHTQAASHTFNINSSEVKSQYMVRGIRPGTRFRATVVVTTVVKHLDVTLKQRLCIATETGIVKVCICQAGWNQALLADDDFCLCSSVPT